MKFLTILTILLVSHVCDSKISVENEQLIRKYLPIYWLHSEEVFNPINFDYYISHMQLQDSDGNVIDANPTAETLLIGPESQALHLNTISDVNCVHCYDEVLFGMPVEQVNKSCTVLNYLKLEKHISYLSNIHSLLLLLPA